MKKAFIKNLYGALSYALTELLIILLISLMFFLVSPEDGDYKIGVIFASSSIAALILSYWIVGFFWIFQWVTINQDGVRICFFKKEIRFVRWKEILFITEEYVRRSHVFCLHVKDKKPLCLDARKSIMAAIVANSCHKILGSLCGAEIIKIQGEDFYSEKEIDTDMLSLLKDEIEDIALERKGCSSFLPTGQCILLRFANGECDILASGGTESPIYEKNPSLSCRSWLLCKAEGMEKIKKYF